MNRVNDDLLVIFSLEILAYLGIMIPLIIAIFWSPVIGIFVAMFWWGIPGAPVPVIHMFFGGWMPFCVAYPMALILACNSYLHDRKWDKQSGVTV